jgi:hypothetical protein
MTGARVHGITGGHMTDRSVPTDHPLVGTWITDEEDSDAAIIIAVEDGEFKVSGFGRSDGEWFEISDIEWDGEWLAFAARMPSTDTRSKNGFRIRPDGKADVKLTIWELWKKKDVRPGELPAAWTRS